MGDLLVPSLSSRVYINTCMYIYIYIYTLLTAKIPSDKLPWTQWNPSTQTCLNQPVAHPTLKEWKHPTGANDVETKQRAQVMKLRSLRTLGWSKPKTFGKTHEKKNRQSHSVKAPGNKDGALSIKLKSKMQGVNDLGKSVWRGVELIWRQPTAWWPYFNIDLLTSSRIILQTYFQQYVLTLWLV